MVFLDKYKKKLGEIEFQNLNQYWVFTTVYRLYKSGWIKAWYDK